MVANGEDVPEPFSAKTYSGKFQVRIPPELHKQLALSAAEEKLSLNRYVSSYRTQNETLKTPTSTLYRQDGWVTCLLILEERVAIPHID